MAVTLRLTRKGSKKRPYYRIIAAESSAKRDGKFLEILGGYDPSRIDETLKLEQERAKYWLDQGAQVSDAVRKILRGKGLLG